MSTLGIETSSGRFDTNSTVTRLLNWVREASEALREDIPHSFGPPQAYKVIVHTKGPCPLLSEPGVVSVPTDPPPLPPRLQTVPGEAFQPLCFVIPGPPEQGGVHFSKRDVG